MASDKLYNEEELNPPQWLNTQFFGDIMRNLECDQNLKITNVNIKPASFKGDHFASVMFRVKLIYEQSGDQIVRSVIAKTLPDFDSKENKMLASTSSFKTEISMYSDILPKFESLLKSYGDDTIFGPKCLYSSLEPRTLLLLEDILPMNYETLQRLPTLDEVKLSYRKLAKFHAVSYKLSTEDPELFKDFKTGLLSSDEFLSNQFMKNAQTHFVAVLRGNSKLERFANYFNKDFLDESKSHFHEYFSNRQTSVPYVLCHGDFHIKNLMFRIEKHVAEVKLLDFQISYMGPIVMDLIYSFVMLLAPSQRLCHKDELISIYHSEFIRTLKIIGFTQSMLALSELQQLLQRYQNFELFLIVHFLPLWYDLAYGSADLHKSFNDHEHAKRIFANTDFIFELEVLLPKLEQLGYFQE